MQLFLWHKNPSGNGVTLSINVFCPNNKKKQTKFPAAGKCCLILQFLKASFFTNQFACHYQEKEKLTQGEKSNILFPQIKLWLFFFLH
jgi:hypothetical protein